MDPSERPHTERLHTERVVVGVSCTSGGLDEKSDESALTPTAHLTRASPAYHCTRVLIHLFKKGARKNKISARGKSSVALSVVKDPDVRQVCAPFTSLCLDPTRPPKPLNREAQPGNA